MASHIYAATENGCPRSSVLTETQGRFPSFASEIYHHSIRLQDWSSLWTRRMGVRLLGIPPTLRAYIDDKVQDCNNSITNAFELLQSCIKPSIYLPVYEVQCYTWTRLIFALTSHEFCHAFFYIWHLGQNSLFCYSATAAVSPQLHKMSKLTTTPSVNKRCQQVNQVKAAKGMHWLIH